MKYNTEWKDYEVLSTSNGEKLERWGDYFLLRPDPQVIWNTGKNLRTKELHAHYHRSQTGGGEWEYLKHLPDEWQVSWRNLNFLIKPMGFKHTGLFPEQAVNWDWMMNKIKNAKIINESDDITRNDLEGNSTEQTMRLKYTLDSS